MRSTSFSTSTADLHGGGSNHHRERHRCTHGSEQAARVARAGSYLPARVLPSPGAARIEGQAVRLRTMALIAGLAAPPLGAWIDMRLAVVRLEDRSADIDRRLERIERSVYGEAK